MKSPSYSKQYTIDGFIPDVISAEKSSFKSLIDRALSKSSGLFSDLSISDESVTRLVPGIEAADDSVRAWFSCLSRG